MPDTSSQTDTWGPVVLIAFGVLLVLNGLGGLFSFADTIALQNLTILLMALGFLVGFVGRDARDGVVPSRRVVRGLWVVVLAMVAIAVQEFRAEMLEVAGFYAVLALLGGVGVWGTAAGR